VPPVRTRPLSIVSPSFSEQSLQGIGERVPAADPDGRTEQAEDEGLGEHGAGHLAAAGTERAEQRELACPLRDEHRERVEDEEAADEERDTGEHQQEGVDELQRVLEGRGLVGRLLLLGGDLVAGTERRGEPFGEQGVGAAVGGGDADPGEAVLREEQPLGSGRVECGHRRPGETAVLPEPEDADQRRVHARAGRQHGDVVADAVAELVRGGGVDGDLSRGRRGMAVDEGRGVQSVVGGPADADAGGAAGVGDVTLGIQDVDAVDLDVSGGRGDTVDGGNLVDQGCRKRGRG
jgi:hypothetical protein